MYVQIVARGLRSISRFALVTRFRKLGSSIVGYPCSVSSYLAKKINTVVVNLKEGTDYRPNLKFHPNLHIEVKEPSVDNIGTRTWAAPVSIHIELEPTYTKQSIDTNFWSLLQDLRY